MVVFLTIKWMDCRDPDEIHGQLRIHAMYLTVTEEKQSGLISFFFSVLGAPIPDFE